MNGNQIAGTIVWNLDVDDSKFKTGIQKARDTANATAKELDQQFSSLGDRISKSFEKAADGSRMFATGLLAVGTATVAAAGFGIKYAADLETMRQGFVTLLGSTEKANAAISQIQKDAASTPFEFKGLVQANQLLTAVTKDAGQSERLLLNVGRALTAMGKGQNELDRIIVNLQQIGAVGKASMIDIKQFAFAGIPIFDMLRDHIKGTGQNLDDFIADGKVTFELLTQLFQNAGEGSGRFAKAFETQGGTLNQVFSNLKDNLGITASQLVTQTGLFDAVKGAVKGLTDQLTYLASPAGIAGVLSVFDSIKANAPIIIGLVAGGLAPAFYAWAAGVWAAMAPLIPFLAIGAAVGVAVKLLIDAFGGWDKTMQALQSGLSAFGEAFNKYVKPGVDSLITNIKTNLLPALTQLWSTIQPILIPALKLLGTVIGGGLILFLRLFVEYINYMVGALTGAVQGITSFINFLKTLPAAFQSFVAFLQTLPAMAGQVITNIITFFQNLPAAIGEALVNTGLKFVEFLGYVTGLIIYGVPVLISNIVTFFQELPGKIQTILTNTATAIAQGFVNIWNWIVTTVPLIIQSVVDFFATLPARIGEWLNTTKDRASQGFTDIWNAIVAEVSSWPGKLYEWGANIANSFVDGIKSAIGKIVDAFKGGLNKAKAMVEGHSPPIAGPFKEIDTWGFNVGTAWVDGVKKAISGMAVENPFSTPIPALAPAQGGTTQIGGRTAPLVNIEQMNVRDESDITDIARELGFRIELSPGYTQNG